MKQTKEYFYNKEEAYNILNRIDLWIGNCDTKFSILLALLGIFFGLTINIFSTFTKLRNMISIWEETIKFDKVICIICCIFVLSYIILIILCTIFSILGINAKIKNTTNNPLFFGNIAKFKNTKEFEQSIKNITGDEYIKFLNEQIYTNSRICTKKYLYYKKSLFCLFTAIIIAIISLLLLSI